MREPGTSNRILLLLMVVVIVCISVRSTPAASDDLNRQFDQRGQLTKRSDDLGNQTIYLRDIEGRVIRTVHRLNRAGSWSERYFYDETDHRIAEIVNPERSLAGRVLPDMVDLGLRLEKDLPAQKVWREGNTTIIRNAFGQVEERVVSESARKEARLLRRQVTRVGAQAVTVEVVRIG